MEPVTFPQATTIFGPPPGLSESQVRSIPAYVGQVRTGSCDGLPQVVVAWKPTPAEIEAIRNGCPIFLSIIGGLPPHCLTTDFESATHPA
jgi:hypothetical protein